MPDRYSYVDPDYTYTDPATGVLRNLADARDHDTLIFIESGAVAKRVAELKAKPLKIKGVRTLLDIHRLLFGDVYAWAGEVRTVEISKGGRAFFPTAHFGNAFAYIDTLIAEYRAISLRDRGALARKLAEILDHINFLHPFREGNGRTQREFLRLLALERGFRLNLNPADNADIHDRYMAGTIDGDVEKLAELISEIIYE